MIIGIAAVDRKGAIGKGGKLPWHYSADMKFFRDTTTGHAVVMGRKTWLTIGKPLKNRLNIVLSRDATIEPQESLVVFSDIESALSFSHSLTTDLFVIGGAQIYEAFLPHIEKWIITEVPLTVSGADAFMPKDYLDGFKVVDSKSLEQNLVVKFYEPQITQIDPD
ncbi:MAG TPA: dihydrofolate reductase [Pyrinomonadaceae bacterium]|jgi:dihydrofolate reductase|nr:dihydrofolate reductase [Pyrinomonadaceae bacterium]